MNSLNSDLVITRSPAGTMEQLTMDLHEKASAGVSRASGASSDAASSVTFMTLFKIGVIVLMLAILGLNVFSYLGIATDQIAEILGPFAKFFGITASKVAKETVQVGAKGAKLGIDVAAGTTTSALDVVEGTIDPQHNTTEQSSKDQGVHRALNHAEDQMKNVQPDDDSSAIQSRRAKQGWCYIGEDKGVRSCMQVRSGDECMSGDIFPTSAVCINPNLRE